MFHRINLPYSVQKVNIGRFCSVRALGALTYCRYFVHMATAAHFCHISPFRPPLGLGSFRIPTGLEVFLCGKLNLATL